MVEGKSWTGAYLALKCVEECETIVAGDFASELLLILLSAMSLSRC